MRSTSMLVRVTAVVATLVAGWAMGCEQVAGVDFDAVHLRGTGGSSASSGSGGGGGIIEPPCVDGDPPGAGVFVSVNLGSDVDGDGTQARPFRTIALALQTAIASQNAAIFLAQGTYAEDVTIRDTETGLFLEGGWVVTGADWRRDCSEAAIADTVIAAPGPVAITVDQVTSASGLRRLTVRTKEVGDSPADAGGESLTGVLVIGDGSVFSLAHVNVFSGRAGNGGTASSGMPPTPPTVSCGGVSDCSTGANGSAVMPGAVAAVGSFGVTGWVSGDGQPGSSGTNGMNGTASTVAPQTLNPCETGCSCQSNNCTFDPNAPGGSGGPGRCGCAGIGGSGAAAGRGGGASVTLLVIGVGATVTIAGGRLEAGDGGNGSPGAAGGSGGVGSSGAQGAALVCVASCGGGGNPCPSCGTINTTTLMGGGPGGKGGDGGMGSEGGAGAGGPSYAVVLIGGANAIHPDTALSHGAGGVGATSASGTAPNGGADNRLTL